MSTTTLIPETVAPQATTSSTLVVRYLKKRYGTRTVVKDVPLDMKSGEVVSLLGLSGADKMTSLYTIAGLVALNTGDITFDGEHISRPLIHQRARVGLSCLSREVSTFCKLNAQENIRVVLELQEQNGKKLLQGEIDYHLGDLLDDSQVIHLRDNPTLSLSGGECRRVEIARALASLPCFILLDELFAGVDPVTVDEIQRTVSFLKDRDIGVLITDHNMRETLGICDHAHIVNEGTVLIVDAPERIIGGEDIHKVRLGDSFRM